MSRQPRGYARSKARRPVIMVGYSMGGANVLSFLLESPLRAQTAAVILDSPVLDFGSTIDYAADQTHLPLTSVRYPAASPPLRSGSRDGDTSIDWDDTDYVSRWRDSTLRCSSSRGPEMRRSRPGPRTNLPAFAPTSSRSSSPPDVGHVLAWNADADGYEDIVNTFLDDLGL